jgi:hypothetical protein
MKPTIAIAFLIVSFIYLSAVICVPRGHSPSNTGDTAVPPRLFQNTGRRVVVQSAEWDKGCKCYVYLVKPL